MTTNNCVDYGQTAEGHRSLLVLVRHTGSALSSQVFNCAYEKISRMNGIHVEGQKRNIVINYRKFYSQEFNSWGDFQAHRKVLGLISIGKCSDQTEFEELFASYKEIKQEYSSSVINSRFIVFGMNTDGTPICDNGNESGDGTHVGGQEENKNIQSTCDNKNDSNTPGAIDNNSMPSAVKKSANGNLAPLAEQEEDGEIDQPENVQTSLTPVKVNNVNSKDSKSSPRSVGKRQHSNSLTKENSGAEIVFYPSLDKSTDFDDRIKEFITSLFYVLEGKRLDRSFERNDKLSLLCAPFERKDYVGVDTDTKSFRKKCMGRLRKHLGDLCLQASMPGEAILHYNTAYDLLKSVNDFLWMAGCLEGLCCSSIILSFPKAHAGGLRRNLSFQAKGNAMNLESKARSGSSYANGLDTLADIPSQQSLNQDDVIDKFKEAITFYSKFKNAAVIEMEASLKACRFLIVHHRYLQASDFLQNVVYINLPSLEDDKIQRYNTLSSLYHQIGFKRKAAFFKRVSGMHCTVPDSSSNWSQCYDLLLQCLEGYRLSINSREMDSPQIKGWPVLQHRVLNELVYAARRNSNPQVAVRHMTLLVDRMLSSLSVAEQREALSNLSNLTAKCPGITKPLVLDNGLILPPVPLLSLPTVRSLKLIPPSPHLQPHKIEGSSKGGNGDSNGVFIYTPLSLTSTKADDSCPDFKWVCGDVCEASVELVNPLVDEMKISHMALVTSDVETEMLSASPVIPPNSKSTLVKLSTRPRESGTLKVQGYSSVVFGVKSNCRLRDLVHLRPSPMTEISMEVIPRLPQVAVSCSLPKSSVFSSLGTGDVVATGSAVLFAGQSSECVITLKNTSDVPVENLQVLLKTKGDTQDVIGRMLKWSEENIESQLPLQPSHSLCFSLCIHGDCDFLHPVDNTRSPMTRSSRSRSDSADGKNLEAALCLEYSGGEGFQAAYCRRCSLGLNLDILPSVYISKWDVQATDSPIHCRLCLDIANVSGHQMTLEYGQDQSLTLDSQHTKRIGIEVLRLDSSQIDSSKDKDESCHIPSFYSTRSVPDPYSQCLGSGLDIRWTMPSTQASGKVNLDYMKWNPEQLSVLVLSDIRWDVHLNGHQVTSSFKPRFDIGQLVELAIEVDTSEDTWPADSFLCIQVHQTQTRAGQALDAEGFAVIGSTVCRVDEAIPNASKVTHSCCFCFFYPGWYYFDIFFSPSSTSSLSPSSSSSLSSPSVCVTSPQQPSRTQSLNLPSADAPPHNSSSTSQTLSSLSNSSSNNSNSSFTPTTTTSGSMNKNSKSLNIGSSTSKDSQQPKNGDVRPGWHYGSAVRFEIS